MREFTLDIVKNKLIKIGKWLGLILIIIISIFLLYKVGTFLKNVFFPPKMPPPEAKFGKLFSRSLIFWRLKKQIQKLNHSDLQLGPSSCQKLYTDGGLKTV